MLGRPTPRSGLLAGRLDGLQSVGHDHPTIDILPITGAFFSLRRTPSMAARRTRSRNGAPQNAGLAGENRRVMPRIVDCLAAAGWTGVLGSDHPFLANEDPVGTADRLTTILYGKLAMTGAAALERLRASVPALQVSATGLAPGKCVASRLGAARNWHQHRMEISFVGLFVPPEIC